jgi:hypothetical protein
MALLTVGELLRLGLRSTVTANRPAQGARQIIGGFCGAVTGIDGIDGGVFLAPPSASASTVVVAASALTVADGRTLAVWANVRRTRLQRGTH